MKGLVPMLAALALVGCNRAPAGPRMTVEDAVVTVPAAPGAPGAAYFRLTTDNEPSRLVGITSPSVRSIELHETLQDGARTRMAPLSADGTTFGPSAPLRFAPGGKHAMLMGLDPSVRPGDKVTLTFQVEPVGTIAAEAEVRGPGQVHAEH